MTHAQLRALCAAILRAELEPDGINVTAYEKTAYAVEQADRLLAALGIAQEEPVSNADELVALRAKLQAAEEDRDKWIITATEQARETNAEIRLRLAAEAEVARLTQTLTDGYLWPSSVVWSSSKMPDGSPSRLAVTPDWVIQDLRRIATEAALRWAANNEQGYLDRGAWTAESDDDYINRGLAALLMEEEK